ncbi:hypothetical protein ACFWBV_11490 [Streptomyces sp. NPDC060030]|uniref:hypothetical protein n=1 Tax=Streptomyces sp. NPDC060030 TaxID=3347042 RepID=UPI003687FB42
MRACFDGSEVPPWDVVESLLQDLAAVRGATYAARESVRAAALCSASAAAHDRRPGGRQALADRLGVMLREQSYAARRLRDADADGAAAPAVGPDALAWARDDHTRATARCAELRARLAAVDGALPGAAGAGPREESAPTGPARTEPAPTEPARPASEPTVPEPTVPEPTVPAPGASEPRRRKPRGARFAGLEMEDETQAGLFPAAGPGRPAPSAGVTAPRGARFHGAPADVIASPAPRAQEYDPAARRASEDTVALLERLRAEGRSGEAHAVLCEAAAWPPERRPAPRAARGVSTARV